MIPDLLTRTTPRVCLLVTVFGISLIFLSPPLLAQEDQKKQEPKKSTPKVEIVVEGLDLPFSVVAHPSSDELFVAESGSGKVLRIVNNIPQDEIVGFETGEVTRKTSAGERKFKTGPVSLCFVSKDMIVVGTAGNSDHGKDKLHLFKVPATSEKYQDISKSISSASIPARKKEVGEGQFFNLGRSGDYVYATCWGDQKIGWLGRASIRDKKISIIRRYTEVNQSSKSKAPSAVTISPRSELVVASSGAFDESKDSVISFFKIKAKEGSHLQNFSVGLHDIVSLQYSPDGSLYALDMCWANPENGGLYKIVAGPDAKCIAKKIATLNGPTSMAFGKNGDLYVTVTNGLAAKKGQLIKVTGLLKSKDK